MPALPVSDRRLSLDIVCSSSCSVDPELDWLAGTLIAVVVEKRERPIVPATYGRTLPVGAMSCGPTPKVSTPLFVSDSSSKRPKPVVTKNVSVFRLYWSHPSCARSEKIPRESRPRVPKPSRPNAVPTFCAKSPSGCPTLKAMPAE